MIKLNRNSNDQTLNKINTCGITFNFYKALLKKDQKGIMLNRQRVHDIGPSHPLHLLGKNIINISLACKLPLGGAPAEK